MKQPGVINFLKQAVAVPPVALLTAGLFLVAAVSLRGADDAAATPAPEVTVVTLEPQQVDFTVASFSVYAERETTAFAKEPALRRDRFVRGRLPINGGATNALAFLWDTDAGKLYLDLNRNLNLTDDPEGVFTWAHERGSSSANPSFNRVPLPLLTPAGRRQELVDLRFWNLAGNQLLCTVTLHSFWQGKVNLHDEEWRVGIVENVLTQTGAKENASWLLLRPWAERNQAFNTDDGSLRVVPFARVLSVHDHTYGLELLDATPGGNAGFRLQFTEQRPLRGEIQIAGNFIERLTLTKASELVVLDRPEGTVRVPVGDYNIAGVWLKNGGAEAYRDARQAMLAPSLHVAVAAPPAVLSVGGPLTNSVTAGRRGSMLYLNYQLLGVGRETYTRMGVGRTVPPAFAIFHGGHQIATGQFEFG